MRPVTDDRKGSRTSVAVWLGAGVLLLPLFYALSMGPMLWLATLGYVSPALRQFLSDFYAPLWIAGSLRSVF